MRTSIPAAVREVIAGRPYISRSGFEFLTGQLKEYRDLLAALVNAKLTPRQLESLI